MESKELIDFFIKNSDKMLTELKKGANIIIKQNKNGFVAYKSLLNKIK